MRKSLSLTLALSALYLPTISSAADADASPWTLTSNVGVVSNYFSRGVSQSWMSPAVQAGVDVAHSSGLYAGFFGSSISERTYVGGQTEMDLYAGYNGTISAVEGLGWTAGLIGYFYPGAGWDKYDLLTTANGGKQVDKDFNTYEANIGASYKWFSTKASFVLGDWYGASKETGWTKDSSGTYYLEANAAIPLPVWDLTLVGHIGRLDVAGELDSDPNGKYYGANSNLQGQFVNTKADMTDYKVGVSKTFKIAASEGWTAGLYYVGGTNGGKNGYWGLNGYGGASFTAKPGQNDLTSDTVVLTLGRTF